MHKMKTCVSPALMAIVDRRRFKRLLYKSFDQSRFLELIQTAPPEQRQLVQIAYLRCLSNLSAIDRGLEVPFEKRPEGRLPRPFACMEDFYRSSRARFDYQEF